MTVSGIGASGSSLSGLSSYGTGGGTKSSSAQAQAQLDALKKRDAEVKTHEKAHQSTGGQFAGAPTYTYQRGPDGQQYAVGGEVSIDASSVRNDPKATADKMRIVERAALAPAQPSAQDQHVAAEAATALAQAQAQTSQGQTAGATGKTGSAQAATNFAAQAIGSAQNGVTSAATTTATAAAAQDGGAGSLRGLLARGVAAYASAASLGANTNQASTLAASA